MQDIGVIMLVYNLEFYLGKAHIQNEEYGIGLFRQAYLLNLLFNCSKAPIFLQGSNTLKHKKQPFTPKQKVDKLHCQW